MEVKDVLKLEMPIVETERLLLRPVCLEDAEDMYAYCSDDEVTQISLVCKNMILWNSLATSSTNSF